MKLLVKVRIDLKAMGEFGKKGLEGGLDWSCIRGERHGLKPDPSADHSIGEAESDRAFEEKFDPGRPYYLEVEGYGVIPRVTMVSCRAKQVLRNLPRTVLELFPG